MYFVFPLCIFRSTFRLSEFRLYKRFSFVVVVVCLFVCLLLLLLLFLLLNRATSPVNLKFVRFSPSTLILSDVSAFLKTSSIIAVKSLGESGSPCLTALFIGNLSDTNLSKWILAVDRL